MLDDFKKDFDNFKGKMEDANGSVKKSLLNVVPSAILILILIATSTIGSLFQFNFDLKTVAIIPLIIGVCLRLIVNVATKYVGADLRYQNALYSEDVLNARKDFITEAKDVDKSRVKELVSDLNLKNKKEAYKARMSYKIGKLLSKKDDLFYSQTLRFSKSREKKIGKLEAKITKLQAQATNDYINNYIQYVNIKYVKLDYTYFLTPTERAESSENPYIINAPGENLKNISKTLPLTIILSLFSSLIGFNVVIGKVSVISILYDVANTIINFIIGWMSGRHAIDRTIEAYLKRTVILQEIKKKQDQTIEMSN